MGTRLNLLVISGLGTMDNRRVISGVTSNFQSLSSSISPSISPSSKSEDAPEEFSVSVLGRLSRSAVCEAGESKPRPGIDDEVAVVNGE